MYTYNLTFAVDFSRVAEFISWASGELIPGVSTAPSAAMNPKLMEVLRPEGEAGEGVDCVSFALQLSFLMRESIEGWKEDYLLDQLTECHRRFGSSVAFFETTLHLVYSPQQN